MVEVTDTRPTSVSPDELFAIKAAAGKDPDALQAAGVILEAFREGYEKASAAGGVNMHPMQEGRGLIAERLLSVIPNYNSLPATSGLLYTEVVRGWIAAADDVQERFLADTLIFSRFYALPEIVRKELQPTGATTLAKVYRILARVTIADINHNAVIRFMVEALRTAPAEHLIAVGKILATGKVDPHFVEFELPKILEGMNAQPQQS